MECTNARSSSTEAVDKNESTQPRSRFDSWSSSSEISPSPESVSSIRSRAQALRLLRPLDSADGLSGSSEIPTSTEPPLGDAKESKSSASCSRPSTTWRRNSSHCLTRHQARQIVEFNGEAFTSAAAVSHLFWLVMVVGLVAAFVAGALR